DDAVTGIDGEKRMQSIEERNRRVLQVVDAVANLQRRGVKAQMLLKEQRPAIAGGRQRYGIVSGCGHHGPVEPPEVSMVWNGTAGSFRTAGADAGKTFIDAGASGVFE